MALMELLNEVDDPRAPRKTYCAARSQRCAVLGVSAIALICLDTSARDALHSARSLRFFEVPHIRS
jgi:hypothetical protein